MAGLLAVLLMAGCLDGSVLDRRDDPSSQADRVERLLTNETDSRIVIHAYYVPGREPVSVAVDRLAGRLMDLTGKLDVTVAPFVALTTETDSLDTNWTVDRVDAVFEGLDVPETARTFTLVILFLDGYGYSGVRVAGYQVERYLAIFPDTFEYTGLTEPVDARVPVPDPEGSKQLEVMLHESGHMLGLINHGAPMVTDHVDRTEECLCHSSNEASIMWSGVDTLVEKAQRGLVDRDFDADDLADLKAFQTAASS